MSFDIIRYKYIWGGSYDNTFYFYVGYSNNFKYNIIFYYEKSKANR